MLVKPYVQGEHVADGPSDKNYVGCYESQICL